MNNLFNRGIILLIFEDIRIPILGIVQSLFEAAMYTFVFMWTPALTSSLSTEEKEEIPFGLIFACYMVN